MLMSLLSVVRKARLFTLLPVTLLLTGCGNDNEESLQTNIVVNEPVLELLFPYGSEKERWIAEATAQFNQAAHKTPSGKRIQIKAEAMGSGESVDRVLSGELQAHLISPASDAFIQLANAKSQQQVGNPLLAQTENLVLSPVVIAMWRPMAEALGWGKKPIGWAEIIALAKDPKGWETYGFPQWGKFKFGHTHPNYSNSGLISLFAEVYAATGKVAGLSRADVEKPETAQYLHAIEQAVVHYGRSTGFFGEKMMENGPGYLSAAVLYENMVIQAYDKQDLPFPIVAVYPKEGTFWSDHPVGIVERDWVSPEHRAAAEQYIQFLLDKPQQQRAMYYGFRPADAMIALDAPLDEAHGIDPKEPKTTLEVPKPDVIHAIKSLWYQEKRHANVVLVLDTSGSMKGEKIANARAGALELLNLMGDQDIFSLLTFDNQAHWSSLKQQPLGQGREAAAQQISNLFANGGTALYDAIKVAAEDLQQQIAQDPDKIAAIVVLSDGADTNSQLRLEQILRLLQSSSEDQASRIRVFPIAYGEGADKNVLDQIANSTQAKAYSGNLANISVIFREISTFF